MAKQKDKKQSKRSYLSLTVLVSLVIAILLPLFKPSAAAAVVEGQSAQQDRTILYALVECLDSGGVLSISGFTANVKGETVREDNISGVVAGGDTDKDAAVGYEVDESDGNAACDGISLTRAMRPIGKNSKWFFEQIYDLNNGSSEDGIFAYPARSGITPDKVARKIKQEMGRHDLAVGKPERLRRLATAFWVCAEPAPDPPDRETSTFGGKKYQLRADAPNSVSVGYDMSNGDPNDGKFECNTLINWGDKDEMAEALRQNPQGSTAGSTAGGGGPSGSLTDCDTKLLNPLSWIICPLIDIGAGASDYIFQNVAKPLLEDVPIELKPSDGAYSAWQGFRFLANIMIIGTMLVIVYVQARGGPS